MAHLTCVGHTKEQLAEVLDELAAGGIENVLSLRGDPPKGQTHFVRPAGGFGYAQELTRFIKGRYAFCVAGAAYPETHTEAPDAETDLRHLKEKVESGAELLIRQLYFEPELYLHVVEGARTTAIDVTIIPGMIPVTTKAGNSRWFRNPAGSTQVASAECRTNVARRPEKERSVCQA